jgi:putative tricarboxylic transport membrane protein
MIRRKRTPLLTAIGLSLATVAACGAAPSGGDASASYPSENLTFVIPFGPGGGTDTLIRTVGGILQTHELWPEGLDIEYEYVEGGSGARGYAFLHNQAGNPYYATTTTGDEVTIPLQAEVEWDGMDFTRIAMLGTSDVLMGVRGDAPWNTLEEFTQHAKQNRVVVGGGGVIGADALVSKSYMQQAAIDAEWVSFDSDGESNAALLSGSIDLMAAPPEGVIGLVESGDMKALAFSGNQLPRKVQEIAPGTPTMAGLGYEILPGVAGVARGFALPPEAPAEAVEWWRATLARVVETPEWEDYLYNAAVTPNFAPEAEFTEVLEQRAGAVAEVLKAGRPS